MIATNRIWILGTVMLTVIVLVAGWFLGASPLLTRAASVNAERAAAQEQNEMNAQTLESLKTRFEDIGELSSAVDVIRTAVPRKADLPKFLAQLSELGSTSQVTVTKVTFSSAMPFVPYVAEGAAPVAATDEAAEPDSAEATDADTVASESDPIAPAVDGGGALPVPNAELVSSSDFIAVPVSLSASGGYAQVMDFAGGLQSGTRLFLMNTLNVGPDTSAEGGDVFVADVSGFIYVLVAPVTSGEVSEVLPESQIATAEVQN